jgi:hypothetical protein
VAEPRGEGERKPRVAEPRGDGGSRQTPCCTNDLERSDPASQWPESGTNGSVLWQGYDLSQYDVQTWGPDDATIVTSPARPGYRYAAKLTTNARASDGLRRVHLHGRYTFSEGETIFYGHSVLIPSSFPSTWDGHQLLLEFFGPPWTGGPPVVLGLNQGTPLQFQAGALTGLVTFAAQRDVWHDFVWELKFSKNPAVGYVKLWHRIEGQGNYAPVVFPNGQTTFFAATLKPDDAGFARPIPGNYHGDNQSPRTIYHATNAAASTFASAAPE